VHTHNLDSKRARSRTDYVCTWLCIPISTIDDCSESHPVSAGIFITIT